MSATLPSSNSAHSPSDVIWSRGGGSFRRLVWKELNEAVGICVVFALGIVIAGVWARFEFATHGAMFTRPILLLMIAEVLFPMIVGARAFAREMESGSWELLRSAGASAWDVWLSKLLVTFLCSVGIALLSGLAISLSLFQGILGGITGGQLRLLLVLTVSMQCSLWLRRSWLAMFVATALATPLVYLTTYLVPEWFQRRISGLPISKVISFLILSDFTVTVLVMLFVALLWMTQLWQLRRELLDHPAIYDSRRWNKVFGRMFWKEMLAVRDFWLAVMGILILLDVCAFWGFREAETREVAIVSLGVLMPLLHSLGCGAITFALEREDGTQDWLRRIAAPTGAVFAAKLLISQVSIVSLTTLVLLGTHAVAIAPANQLNSHQCAMLLMAVTLNGVVSLGASLLTRRVLPAMILAFVGVVAIDFWMIGMAVTYAPINKDPVAVYSIAILLWLLIGMVLMAVEWRLADRWLNERPWWSRRRHGETPRGTPFRGAEFWFDWSSSPEKKGFGRLMWREWMEVKGWLWTLPMIFAPSIFFNMLNAARRVGPSPSWLVEYILFPTCGLMTFGFFVLPALLGVWAFHHDQRQGLFRFLADRGGSPRQIWWSKQAVWLILALVLAGLAGAITEVQSSVSQREGLAPGQLTGLALVFALQSYAAGQAMSQWNRSALISTFLAGVLSLLLGGWMQLLVQVDHAPWPYQLGAAAILFFASWRSSRDWLEERWSWRAWLRIVLSTALPFVGLVLLLELQGYRVWDTLRNWPMFR